MPSLTHGINLSLEFWVITFAIGLTSLDNFDLLDLVHEHLSFSPPETLYLEQDCQSIDVLPDFFFRLLKNLFRHTRGVDVQFALVAEEKAFED